MRRGNFFVPFLLSALFPLQAFSGIDIRPVKIVTAGSSNFQKQVIQREVEKMKKREKEKKTFASEEKGFKEAGTVPSFFSLYERNRQEGISNYITSDFILTAFSLFKRELLTEMEEKKLYPLLKELSSELLKEYMKSYDVSGTKEAKAYLVVLNKLLGNEVPDMDPSIREITDAEINLIENGSMNISPIAGVKIDYSIFKPTGIYAGNTNLKNYFRAMKFVTTIPFIVVPSSVTKVSKEKSDSLLISAYQIGKLLSENKNLFSLYNQLEESLSLFAGKSDDLSPAVFKSLLIMGGMPEEIREEIVLYAKENNLLPEIVSFVVDGEELKKSKDKLPLLSIKLIPSRFSLDSFIFQNLLYPEVGKFTGKNEKLPETAVKTPVGIVRGFPTILDIPAVLEPKKAKKLEKENGEYENFYAQIEKLHGEVSKRIKSPGNVYSYDFEIYRQLLKEGKLRTFKGYYTQSRYGLNLYLKQSFTPVAKSLSPSRDMAKVDREIGSFINIMIEELYHLNSFYPSRKTLKFISILKRLRAVVKSTKDGIVKSSEDVVFLNNLDTAFDRLLKDKDHPIAVDIHTEPNTGKVLIEGLCYPIVVESGKFRGAIYNHKEVKSSMRLTDEEWERKYCSEEKWCGVEW